MKFEIKNWLTRTVQFVAEIECDKDASTSIKIGLAVKWAFKNKADLRGADLRGADLQGADLRGADLRGADLRGAYLQGAYLQGAYLQGAYLQGAYLQGADLRGADLQGAYLQGADLQGAYLQGADLRVADLRGAYLQGAYLQGADLRVHKLAVGESFAHLGFPDGWFAYTYFTDKKEQRVSIGCQDKTLAEGKKYWAKKSNRREVFASLAYAKAIAVARKWGKE